MIRRFLPLLALLCSVGAASARAQDYTLTPNLSLKLPKTGSTNWSVYINQDLLTLDAAFVQSGGGSQIKVNGGSSLTSPVNFQNGGAINGITINFSNPSGSNIRAAIAGTLTDVGLASAYSGIGACSPNQWVNTLSRNAGPGCAQPGFSNLSGIITVGQTALTTNNDLLTVTGGVLARLATGTPNQVLHGTNIWGLINLAADVTNTLPLASGGTSASTQQAALNNLMPTPIRAGDIVYWNGTNWVNLGGNNSGTACFQENSSGLPSFGACGGAGVTFQANGVNLSNQTTVNYVNSGAVNGITLLASNPSAGQVTYTLSGTLTNAGLSNSSLTYNGVTVALGASGNLGQLNDTNGNPSLKTATTASAVDQITVTNAAAANPATVSLSATGTDANINLNLVSKGSGGVQVNGNPVGTATSVGLSGFTSGIFSTAGSPVLTSGVIAVTLTGSSGGIPYFSSSSVLSSSAALTANLPVIGGGAGSAPSVGTVTGNTTQFPTWTGVTTASRCVDTDASGNLHVTASDCNTSTTAFQVNGTPLTSSTTVNYQNSAAFNGLTATFSNPSAGNVQLGFSGTLGNAGLTNSSVTINAAAPMAGGGAVSLGGTLSLSITGAAGQVLAGATPAFTATPTLGVAATTTGQLILCNGNASGACVTVQNNAATVAYNFNLPATPGSAGQVLTSQGGGGNAMTWAPSTGITVQTNAVNNTLQTTLNFITSTTNSIGGTITPSNPATGNEKFELTGTILPVGGGTGLSSPADHSLLIAKGSSNMGLLTSPATNGFCVVGFNVTGAAAVDPICSLQGVPVLTPASGYNGVYSDRATAQRLAGGSTFTWNLPQITGPTASNMPIVYFNDNSGLLSLVANAADKINNSATGGTYTALPNTVTFLYQDSSSAPGNWWPETMLKVTAFGATCANPIAWSTTVGISCLPGNSGGIPYFSAANTWASSAVLTANLPVIGGGAGAAPTVGTATGNTTQFATWTGATTASRCVDTDASGNLHITTLDCNSGGGTPAAPLNSIQFNNNSSFGGFGSWTPTPPTMQLPASSTISSQNVGGPSIGFGAAPTLPTFCNAHPCNVNGWGGIYGVLDGGYMLGGTNFFAFQRVKVNQGTVYSGADAAIVLTSGWGSGAAVSAAAGYDQAFSWTATCGTSPGANPVVTVTFKDGTWTGSPQFFVTRNDTVAPTPATFFPTWVEAPTTLTITMQGTCTATNVYKFKAIALGN